MNIFLVSGICGLIDFIILAYNQIFVNNIYHHIRSLTNKNDISYKYIETIPIELQKLLLENDKVKEFNEKNINIDNGSNKNLNDININDNIENVHKVNEKSEINNNNVNVLNNENNIQIYVSNKSNNILQTTKKVVKKKIVKKKKKKKSINIDKSVGPSQELGPNAATTMMNGGKEEINQIKNNKVFNNIKFNSNRNNTKINSRNEISKGQLSSQNRKGGKELQGSCIPSFPQL
jgi:hypothetical protein